jgi:hypothetical protein
MFGSARASPFQGAFNYSAVRQNFLQGTFAGGMKMARSKKAQQAEIAPEFVVRRASNPATLSFGASRM